MWDFHPGLGEVGSVFILSLPAGHRECVSARSEKVRSTGPQSLFMDQSLQPPSAWNHREEENEDEERRLAGLFSYRLV